VTLQDSYHNVITARLLKLSNRELLEMVYECSIPDDYDGDFTINGHWLQDESRRVLEERLVECGFIDITECDEGYHER